MTDAIDSFWNDAAIYGHSMVFFTIVQLIVSEGVVFVTGRRSVFRL